VASHGIVALREAVDRKEMQVNECLHGLRICDEEIAGQQRLKQTISLNLGNRERELAEMKADLARLTQE
jgi:hypothetical protein